MLKGAAIEIFAEEIGPLMITIFSLYIYMVETGSEHINHLCASKALECFTRQPLFRSFRPSSSRSRFGSEP